MSNYKYAYRLETRRIKEPDFPYNGQALTCSTELVTFAKSLYSSDIEKMLVLFLDNQNHLCGIWIQPGTTNQAIIYPREILKHAILSGAAAIILIHNHPSGNINPSDPDIRLTATLKESIKSFDLMLHDHLILGEDKWFSFREEGIMP
jgi:DNA repair protein RadC